MNALVLGLMAVSLAAGERPDFSGEWKIDPEASKTAPLPAPRTQTLTVVHRDPEMSVAQRTATGLPRDYKYKTDGAKTENLSPHGVKLESKAEWSGGQLIIRTGMSASGLAARMEERWSLSGDKKTLTVTRDGSIFVYRLRQ
ncbi:MAG: hypothetical protein JST93_33850 [Acidobacteria bacterium]|nr:hypothetical protein [Acidobacteriota bacterium]